MKVFVARQPIFDIKQTVYGYELLYRLGADNFYDHPDGDRATSEVIANSFLLIGIESLTGGKRAFINFTRNLLLNGVAALLPNDLLAVEVLEDVEPSPEILEACRQLKEKGYPMVLDDFILTEKMRPLVKIADIIKIDFQNSTSDYIKNVGSMLRNSRVRLLAEKVETREQFEQALEWGYSYFQGYFFSKPVILSGRDVQGYKLNYLQILQEVTRPEVDIDQVESIIKRDVSLSYKLLKYINSAAFGFRTRIESIRHALVLLGVMEIKKWVSLLVLKDMGQDKPDEIMTTSVIRARFGELIAPVISMKDKAPDLFLMGMFSMIDALMDRPMGEVLQELPISDDVKGALLGRESRYRDVFGLVLSYEKGNWAEFSEYASRLRLDEREVPGLFLDALTWANQLLHS